MSQEPDANGIVSTCIQMIEKEEEGETARSYFDRLLAETFCFRRANGSTIGKQEFLEDLQAGARQGRKLMGLVDVIHYENLAVASLLVGIGPDRFRNVRIFIRENGAWQLQMWCNLKM